MDYKKLALEAQDRLSTLDEERKHLLGLIEHAQALAGAHGAVALAETMSRPLYAGKVPGRFAGGTLVTAPRRAAPTMAPTREAARALLEEYGEPIETRDLLPLIQERGIEVGGKDPIATLSARLSNSDEFVVRRGVGWWFSDRPFPGDKIEEAEEVAAEVSPSASSEDDDKGGDPDAAALI